MAGWINNLPIIVAVVPLVGSAVVSYTVRRGDTVPAGLTGLISFITLTLTWWQFLLVRQHGILTCGLPGSLGLSLNWRVDFIGAFFSVVVAAVWFLATIFAREYMEHEHSQTRFFASSIFTLGSTLGVFVAGDLFTLFLFFEMMTFAAHLLVIHEQERESMSRNVYLHEPCRRIDSTRVIFILQFASDTQGLNQCCGPTEQAYLLGWFFCWSSVDSSKGWHDSLHIWLPRLTR